MDEKRLNEIIEKMNKLAERDEKKASLVAENLFLIKQCFENEEEIKEKLDSYQDINMILESSKLKIVELLGCFDITWEEVGAIIQIIFQK